MRCLLFPFLMNLFLMNFLFDLWSFRLRRYFSRTNLLKLMSFLKPVQFLSIHLSTIKRNSLHILTYIDALFAIFPIHFLNPFIHWFFPWFVNNFDRFLSLLLFCVCPWLRLVLIMPGLNSHFEINLFMKRPRQLSWKVAIGWLRFDWVKYHRD